MFTTFFRRDIPLPRRLERNFVVQRIKDDLFLRVKGRKERLLDISRRIRSFLTALEALGKQCTKAPVQILTIN